jgi:hypothetical protein
MRIIRFVKSKVFLSPARRPGAGRGEAHPFAGDVHAQLARLDDVPQPVIQGVQFPVGAARFVAGQRRRSKAASWPANSGSFAKSAAVISEKVTPVQMKK